MLLKEVIARFGLEFDGSGLQSAQQGLAGLGQSFGKLKTVITGGAIGAAVFGFASHLEEMGGELEDTAGGLGLSAAKLFEWRGIADTAGVGARKLNAALVSFSGNVNGAAHGSAAAAAGFRKLGISVKDSEGNVRDTSELFEETGLALARMPEGAERTALAMSLMGNAGRALLPAFANGAEGLQAYRADIEELVGRGGIQTFLEQTGKMGEEVDRSKLAFTGLQLVIGREVVPMVTDLVRGAVGLWREFQHLTQGTQVVKAGFKALGIAAVIAGAIMIPPFLPAILTFAAIAAAVVVAALVIEDLTRLFNGQQSAIKDWIDEIWGIGQTDAVIGAFKLMWEDIVSVFERVYFESRAMFLFWKDVGVNAVDLLVQGVELLKPAWESAIEVGSRLFQTIEDIVNAAANGVNAVKDFFGFGEDDAPAAAPRALARSATAFGPDLTPGLVAAAGGASALANSPNLAPGIVRSGGGGGAQVNSANTFNITGSNPTQIAEQVGRILEERDGENYRAAQAALTPLV